MDLTPVSTKRRTHAGPLFQEVLPPSDAVKARSETSRSAGATVAKSPGEALEILRGEPGYEALITTLRLLKQGRFESEEFHLASPSPLGAQIIHALVTDIAPNYWALLHEDAVHTTGGGSDSTKSGSTTDVQLFLDCVTNLPGINAVLLRIRALTLEAKSEKKDAKRPDIVANLSIMLALLAAILKGTDCIEKLWAAVTETIESPAKRRPLAQELLALFGGGRVVSYAAEAEEFVRVAWGNKRNESPSWIGDGAEYTRWLSRNITSWASAGNDMSNDDMKLCADLLSRSLRLGYADIAFEIIMQDMLLSATARLRRLSGLVDALPSVDQPKFIFAVLKLLSSKNLNKLGSCESTEALPVIAGAAGAVNAIVGTNTTKLGHLVSWLTSASGAGLGDSVGIRRAVMAVVAQSRDSIISVLEKSLGQFGDQLYIKHSPILQQEAHAQVLMLSAGYAHRLAPMKLTIMMRSAVWLNAISNRLAAPQERSRYLGMVVGEALSGLVDNGSKRLDFHMEETNHDEGRWYKGLVNVADSPGPVDVLRRKEHKSTVHTVPIPDEQNEASQGRATRQPKLPPRGFVVEEVDDEESEEEDLIPYAKPDSDAEDSDEDATLVRRDKPKAPVYIRDLIRYLRDTEDYDHQKLALNTAPGLIRRKGNFGTEVKEHADELASLLIGLQDKFDMDNFYQLRLQGMIALVVAQPEIMGQWFAKTFYDGDYSTSQRTSILAVLGLGARELAGLETSEYAEMSSFPSKALPERVERLFIDPSSAHGQLGSASQLKPLPANALDTAAQSLTNQLLAPIAAEAADAVTGPDALKLSTFTSRLEQQQSGATNVKRKPASRPRMRAIPNTTAQLLYSSFFSPLVARFQAALRSSSRTRGALIFQQPQLLATYLRTLGVVAHAAGPGTLALPAMTSELWMVLLRARTVGGGGDLGVVRAVLFSLLALLDVNEDRMRDVCAEMGPEVVETMQWVNDLFESTRGGDGGGGKGGDEDEVKMMSAAVLIRLREGVEKYRALLLGDMIGY